MSKPYAFNQKLLDRLARMNDGGTKMDIANDRYQPVFRTLGTSKVQVVSAVELITPEKAKKMLEANVDNRKLRMKNAQRFAKLMKAGRWLLTTDAIGFDATKRLVNGQTRLTAVVLSGTAQPFLVVRNLDPDVFKWLDQGLKRQLHDALHVEGHRNTNQLAANLRVIAPTVVNGAATPTAFGGQHPLYPDDYLEFLSDFPRVLDSTAFGERHSKTPENPVPSAVYAFLHFFYGEDKIGTFAQQLSDGLGITDRRNPAFLLRRTLTNIRNANDGKADRVVIFAYSILAANLAARSEKRALLRWVKSDNTPFPQPDVAIPEWTPEQ